MNPSTPSPSLARPLNARPTPPGRTKRHSLTPTSRANISRSIDAAKANSKTPTDGLAPIPSPRGALMQGLRDRNEEDISKAGRVELERVLREEWESKDRLITRIENLSIEQDRLENERKELVQSLGGLQSRVDEAFSEQGRLEADVEGRDQMLERMRIKAAETDKALRETQRRYTEQEKSFEAEREAYKAQETHLQSRIHTLTRSSSSKPSSSTSTSDSNAASEHTSQLEEELASLSAAHCSLIAQYNTISKDLSDAKTENKRLEEENAGWELLMRDQTMSGSVRGRGIFSEDWLDEGEWSEGEMEGMDGGRGKGSAGQASGTREDGGAGRERGKVKGTKGGRTVLESLDEEMEMGLEDEGTAGGMGSMGSGGDLAAELAKADGGVQAETGVVQPIKPSEADALRAEIKGLKDANKALSLYCSKIIDRIIAQEGFEHVLSVDYKTRRGRSATDAVASSSTSGRPRGSVQDLVHNMHAQQGVSAGDDFLQNHSPRSPVRASMPLASAGMSVSPTVPTSVVTPPTPAKEPRKARPLSMMVRGWSYAGDAQKEAEKPVVARGGSVSPEKVQVDKEEAVKEEKRAKRGFSIDFRSFGFGSSSSSSSAPAEPKGLKPLTLPQRAASGSYPSAGGLGSASGGNSSTQSRATSPILPSPTDGHARKLPQMEEDEEDKRERHRMEAAMRLMGINRIGTQAQAALADHEARSRQGSMLSSPVEFADEDVDDHAIGCGGYGRADSASPDKARVPLAGTPLSRLTTALAPSGAPGSSTNRHAPPMLELADPMSPVNDDAALAALKAFDAREAEQAKAMAQGKAMTEFTTPRRIGEGRRRLSGRRAPGHGLGQGQGSPEKGRTVSKSESISTLFSAGTDSPSGSVDLGRGNKGE